MINMTAASMGCELAPFAMAADTMLSPKVNFRVVNNNLIFGYNGKNSSYFGGIGKDFGGNLGKIALNNNGKGFLYQSSNNKFGIIGLARENAVPYKPGILPTTPRNALPIYNNMPRIPNNGVMPNRAAITYSNPLLIDEGGSNHTWKISNRTKIYENLQNETQKNLNKWLKVANDPKNKTLSKNKLKPAFSTSYNAKTEKYYNARNLTRDEIKLKDVVYHPYVKKRIDSIPKNIYDSYEKMTNGAGTHAECLTLNKSMLDQFCIENEIQKSELTQEYIDKLYKESPEKFKQNPNDTIIYVVNSHKLNNSDFAIPGNPMPRCPHCKYVTLHADVLDDVLEKEKEMYKKRFQDLIFDE
ncbi:YwqJ-related putative deaminase [Clostridium weizhouense]|uniref:Uncharacterized protein n=1 Tax=Clostridium weizhouense TaxID=2859781 RepID=A0ABS7AV60_9CLOT|nr:YwqJ-related putative deaminase [Clostridium weizhouense]MBW6411871.1 hypothetical protein [Clostridium weizhouense]